MLTQKFRIAALAVAAGGLTLSVPAAAIPAAHASAWANTPAYAASTVAYDDDDDDDRRWGRRDRYERREARRYHRDERRYHREQQQRYRGEQAYQNTRVWQGNDGRYYCRKSDGTTGLLIGGAAGALLGREIAGRNGDRTLGAILGAAGGALLGKSIDSKTRCN